MPAESVAGVTVIAPSAAIADALATAFYVGGAQLAERYCLTHPGILVVMLETGPNGQEGQPLRFGSHPQCDVEMIYE